MNTAGKRDLSALDAKFEAQKIAFAPLAFQAVVALRKLGLLQAVSDAGDRGLSREEAAEAAGISVYGAGTLLEMAAARGVVLSAAGDGGNGGDTGDGDQGEPDRAGRFTLGKTGWFLLEDPMTAVNLDFVNDVCYRGAFDLARSVKTGRPEGLKVFGDWSTIYEGLAFLPEDAKKSWFAFDHFYSDAAFAEALPLVFSAGSPPRRILDIGGNTARWAIRCCRHDPAVRVTVADLPGQTAEAERAAAEAGMAERIAVYPCDVLDPASALPGGHDIIWMSQFLDCFALEDITAIIRKAAGAATEETTLYVLEPFWDRQRFEAASWSLRAVSLYFTSMANGRSKMYRREELREAVEAGGFVLSGEWHNLGPQCYSLLAWRLKP
jgi:hypothetical protein